ncbi:MAG: hypothetical protein U0793_12850 [Gemmataceae bacterium]
MEPAIATVAPQPACLSPQEQDDWTSYFRLLKAGQLDQYVGKFVVVHKKAVVAFGEDPDALRTQVAGSTGIDPNRMTIAFIDRGDV